MDHIDFFFHRFEFGATIKDINFISDLKSLFHKQYESCLCVWMGFSNDLLDFLRQCRHIDWIFGKKLPNKLSAILPKVNSLLESSIEKVPSNSIPEGGDAVVNDAS